MYAKLINGKLRMAPNPIIVDTETIANPSSDILKQQGYLPVIEKKPDYKNDCYYTPVYTESNNKIYQRWEEHKVDSNLEDDKLAKLEQQVSKNTEDITATQEALCELYETVV